MWEHVSGRFDENQDGQVTRDEFERGQDRFAQLDRNADGVLTEDDFQGGAGRHGGMIARLADADRNREVTPDEWQELIAAIDPDGDGVITDEELAAFFESRRPADAPPPAHDRKPPMGGRLDRNEDGVLGTDDLNEIFAELDTNGDQTLQSDELPPPGRGHRGSRGKHGGSRSGGGS
ncbi:MAG: hypothetical protein GY856_13285 [bacterium]|nr:hypothetical protein [bacterium]